MGMTNWRGVKPRKEEVAIAKNYLKENELASLNNLVEQYLIFAEGQAMRKIPMYMKAWIEKLNGFLKLNDRNILENAGRISHEIAKELAEKEYDKFYKKLLKTQNGTDVYFDILMNKTAKVIGHGKKKRIEKKNEK